MGRLNEADGGDETGHEEMMGAGTLTQACHASAELRDRSQALRCVRAGLPIWLGGGPMAATLLELDWKLYDAGHHPPLRERSHPMRLHFLVVPLAAITLLGAAPQATAPDAAEAKALVAKLQTTLQGELLAAMKEGGPARAIEVCRDRAPKVASEISRESGWAVARTALKVRNPENAPDAWEKKVLEEFAVRAAAGEDVATLERSGIVETAGTKTFRFMKAIRTGELCLACQGASMKPELAAKVKTLYPEDRATGFAAGDMRGAFTLAKKM